MANGYQCFSLAILHYWRCEHVVVIDNLVTFTYSEWRYDSHLVDISLKHIWFFSPWWICIFRVFSDYFYFLSHLQTFFGRSGKGMYTVVGHIEQMSCVQPISITSGLAVLGTLSIVHQPQLFIQHPNIPHIINISWCCSYFWELHSYDI